MLSPLTQGRTFLRQRGDRAGSNKRRVRNSRMDCVKQRSEVGRGHQYFGRTSVPTTVSQQGGLGCGPYGESPLPSPDTEFQKADTAAAQGWTRRPQLRCTAASSVPAGQPLCGSCGRAGPAPTPPAWRSLARVGRSLADPQIPDTKRGIYPTLQRC
eukprot:gene14974-biopygen12683